MSSECLTDGRYRKALPQFTSARNLERGQNDYDIRLDSAPGPPQGITSVVDTRNLLCYVWACSLIILLLLLKPEESAADCTALAQSMISK